MKNKKKLRRCAICGGPEATTDDHLPPQSLYPKPRPSNERLFSVPACRPCNNGSNADDEEFKIVMGLMRGDGTSSELYESLIATLDQNARLKRAVYSGVPTMVFDEGKLRTGPIRIVFDRSRYNNVVVRIVKGLYWHETGNYLGKDTPVKVIDQASLTSEAETRIRELLKMPGLVRRTLNNETLIYKYLIQPNGESFWALQFFAQHATFGFAGCPVELTTPVSASGN